jgi:hypothetical protein
MIMHCRRNNDTLSSPYASKGGRYCIPNSPSLETDSIEMSAGPKRKYESKHGLDSFPGPLCPTPMASGRGRERGEGRAEGAMVAERQVVRVVKRPRTDSDKSPKTPKRMRSK